MSHKEELFSDSVVVELVLFALASYFEDERKV